MKHPIPETPECAIRLASDGSAIAMDWTEADGGRVTTVWPVAAIPALVDMLLGAAQSSAPRQREKLPEVPSLKRVFTPTRVELLRADNEGPVLRVSLGVIDLDFALSEAQVAALGQAAPAARSGRRFDA